MRTAAHKSRARIEIYRVFTGAYRGKSAKWSPIPDWALRSANVKAATVYSLFRGIGHYSAGFRLRWGRSVVFCLSAAGFFLTPRPRRAIARRSEDATGKNAG